MMLRSFALFSLFVTLAGCSSEPATTDTPEAFDSPSPNEPCSTLANVAQPIDIVDEATEPPAPTGGTLLDGTYVVTKAVRYTKAGGSSGPTGERLQMTVRLDGQTAESTFDGVGRRARLVVDGVNLRTIGICPNGRITEAPFSSNASGLSLYLNGSKGTRVYFFSRI